MKTFKTFKFDDKIIKLLEEMAKEENTSRTRIIENLIYKEAIKKGLET